jgi:hypothetical protein
MEPINTTSNWETPDAPSAGVERILRLQNVATQLQLLIVKTSRDQTIDKKMRDDITTDNDAD